MKLTLKSIFTLLFILVVIQSTVAQKATTYAIVVGIADYKYIGDLTFTVPDAKKVYAFLKSQAGGAVPTNHIRFLTNETATKANIMKEMNYIFSFARPQDRVIFYFSGHGATGFFCASDIRINGNEAENALWHDEIKDAFKKCRARTKLCIADACYAGSIKGVDTYKSVRQKGLGLEEKSAGIAVIMASKYNQTSGEDARLQQGFFSYFMIQGLSGKSDVNRDKIVTIKELFSYVWKNVKTYSKGRQVPIMFSNTYTMPVAYLN
ncbi:caspase family protein [Runella aurantiaca]|uniref:Caspase family protein n=1 Tax=Runella aurantiaca TaxID=2282308 RepID=A0A369IE28_9BACT|nr:caspase family protein [Runella aurantiaca]RDB07100.1 caspase family protein [Runella aurantiaca]